MFPGRVAFSSASTIYWPTVLAKKRIVKGGWCGLVDRTGLLEWVEALIWRMLYHFPKVAIHLQFSVSGRKMKYKSELFYVTKTSIASV